MANHEQVAILKKGGGDAWNKWLNANPSGAALLSGGADLIKANLSGADLSGADLSGASLMNANLSGANLSRTDLSLASLINANLSGANLSGAKLVAAQLFGANLTLANLTLAKLGKADLIKADLTGADLSRTDLSVANLMWSNLTLAKLGRANLMWSNLTLAKLGGADLSKAILSQTVFGDTTLAQVRGLDQCIHQGPSIVDFQTLKNSGPLPIAFLRGVGLPDNLIESLPSLLNEAIQFFSCFISYSGKDEAFAERLHADLQNRGVRCWFAPHDMPIGAKIIDALDEGIRLRQKVLLILSKGAIASEWVESEVTTALDEERTRKQLVLFPVRIDDAVMQTSEAWARLLRVQRNIGDFTQWKEHDSYQESFERLMRDLRVESGGGR